MFGELTHRYNMPVAINCLLPVPHVKFASKTKTSARLAYNYYIIKLAIDIFFAIQAF